MFPGGLLQHFPCHQWPPDASRCQTEDANVVREGGDPVGDHSWRPWVPTPLRVASAEAWVWEELVGPPVSLPSLRMLDRWRGSACSLGSGLAFQGL
eukprot:6276583-Prorocentrum_lima.AAC.1